MPAGTWLRSCPPVLLSLALLVTPLHARAQVNPDAVGRSDLSSIKVVDAFNLFPNVRALIYFAEPNDFGVSRYPGCGGSSTTSGRAGLFPVSCATAIPARPRSSTTTY
jgi:hypothetical protein